MKRLGLIAVAFLALAFAGPAVAQQEVYICYYTPQVGPNNQPTCSLSISPASPTTAGALTLVAGATAQPLFGASEVLHGCSITNPPTAAEQGIGAAESITIDFTGHAAVAGGGLGTTILEAGQSVGCGAGITNSISWIATTIGHKINAVRW